MLISKKSDRIPVDFTSSGEFSSRGICHPISKTPPRTGGSGHPEPEWHDSYFICSLWAATHHRVIYAKKTTEISLDLCGLFLQFF